MSTTDDCERRRNFDDFNKNNSTLAIKRFILTFATKRYGVIQFDYLLQLFEPCFNYTYHPLQYFVILTIIKMRLCRFVCLSVCRFKIYCEPLNFKWSDLGGYLNKKLLKTHS